MTFIFLKDINQARYSFFLCKFYKKIFLEFNLRIFPSTVYDFESKKNIEILMSLLRSSEIC